MLISITKRGSGAGCSRAGRRRLILCRLFLLRRPLRLGLSLGLGLGLTLGLRLLLREPQTRMEIRAVDLAVELREVQLTVVDERMQLRTLQRCDVGRFEKPD